MSGVEDAGISPGTSGGASTGSRSASSTFGGCARELVETLIATAEHTTQSAATGAHAGT